MKLCSFWAAALIGIGLSAAAQTYYIPPFMNDWLKVIADRSFIEMKQLNNEVQEKVNNILELIESKAKVKVVVEDKCNDVCLTPGCVHTASRVLDKMDTTVKPCDDFYHFACGNFINKTVIPVDRASVDTFSIINDKLQNQLRSMVNEKINPNDTKPFVLAKKLYKACMNETLIDNQGFEPFLNIADKLGGWPVVIGNGWDPKSEWKWTWAVQEFRKVGFSLDYVLGLYIDIDVMNSTNRIIYIDQAILGINREYLIKGFEDNIVRAYYKYMVDIAVFFGANRKRAVHELRESLEFEMKLANISLSNEQLRNNTALYNRFTLRKVQQMYPYIQWAEYINVLLPAPLSGSVNENEKIVVTVPSYFEGLGKLLQETPKRTVANYMMWRATFFSSASLSTELRDRYQVYSEVVNGNKELETRWKECIDITSGRLSIAVGALYVREYFSQNSRAAASEMVDEIRKAFEVILNNVNWMDDKTRKSAINKLKAMTTHIGYPDELMDDDKIAEYYKNLEIDENNYLLSILNLNVFDTDYAFNKLREPVNKTDWIDHADLAVVNAFYAPIENSIQIPAGILQGQFFSFDHPRYMNFGAIGYVIGHEITHGYDDQGLQYDLNGDLYDWWDPNTKKHYLQQIKCIIEQYGNFTEPTTGYKLNGVNTQGENIADNGGIKESYYAYQKWQEENGPEPRLPGLDYTPQQMFWISAAQTWCGVYRQEYMRMQIRTDVHSPAEFRVFGPLSNRKEFANDFHCPMGSPMNPVKKCEVW